jgi:3-oxoacyl-[acyl-carrier-protein] synthase-3
MNGNYPMAGIRAVSTKLPARTAGLEELEADGLLTSPASALREMGFDTVHVATEAEAPTLAADAGNGLLEAEGIDPSSIDALVLFGALHPIEVEGDAMSPDLLIDEFRYPVGRLHHDLGLANATALSVGQQGCATMPTAMRLATSMIRSGEARRVLCVGTDVVPAGKKREVIYNVLSDGACAFLMEAGHPRMQPVAFRQVTKGYYWDSPARRTEIVAAYYPTARNVILDALEAASVDRGEVALFIPDNISARSWAVLLDLVGIPKERAFLDNIAKHGHFVSSDNIVNLKDALDERPVADGSAILLFTFGFGANWSATVIRA